MIDFTKKVLKYLLIAAVWIAIWQICAMAVGEELLFPTPLAVLMKIFEFFQDAEFYRTLAFSLLRITAGMLLGTAIGIIGGIATAFLRFAKSFFAPLLAILKSTPVSSFILLIVLWIQRDTAPLIIAAMMAIPIVWTNVETGIINTDKSLIEMAKIYKMSRFKKFEYIYFPSVVPYFIASARSSIGMSWKAGIAAEVLLQPMVAIGKMIYQSKILLETVDLFAWTAIVIILSIIIERLALLLFSRALKKYSFKAMEGAI